MAKFCSNCGHELNENDGFCAYCGTSQGQNAQSVNQSQGSNNVGNTQPKSKLAAGLLGIFLGAWGIHNFYLGNTQRGIIQIVLTIVTCGLAGIWGFVEGILILTGSISTDANGVPLQD